MSGDITLMLLWPPYVRDRHVNSASATTNPRVLCAVFRGLHAVQDMSKYRLALLPLACVKKFFTNLDKQSSGLQHPSSVQGATAVTAINPPTSSCLSAGPLRSSTCWKGRRCRPELSPPQDGNKLLRQINGVRPGIFSSVLDGISSTRARTSAVEHSLNVPLGLVSPYPQPWRSTERNVSFAGVEKFPTIRLIRLSSTCM